MKKILLVLSVFAGALFASCDKKDTSSNEMNAEELKAKHGIVLPDLQYEGDEIETASPNSQGKKKQSAALVTVVLWYWDQTIDITGTTITGSVSPNAYHASAQKFVDTTTVDGAKALWGCNRSYSAPPGPGTTTTCQTEGPGWYRVYSADFNTYDIHLSPFKQVQ
jgi:type IV pilus biogenesis protein CpaD/CtpE